MKGNFLTTGLLKLLGGLKLESLADVGREPHRFGPFDSAVLKTTMALAALDGRVTGDELDAFARLAKKCRGYNDESANELFRDGLRSAGYIELSTRVLKPEELRVVFEDEVRRILPEDFACESAADLRRAFVTWMTLAMSDGDYSEAERQAVAFLSDLVVGRIRARRRENDRLQAFSPAFATAYRDRCGETDDTVLDAAFFAAAEDLVRRASKGDETAEAGLARLIENGAGT